MMNLWCAIFLATVVASLDAMEISTERQIHATTPRQIGATQYAAMFNASMDRFLKRVHSEQCRDKVESALMLHSRSLLEDDVYPFENVRFHSRCPMATVDRSQMPIGRFIINNSKQDAYVPTSNASLTVSSIAIAYVLLTHAHASFSYRLITALNSSNTVFIVHVDGKAHDTYSALVSLAGGHSNVHFVQDRQIVSWGAFSVVNATLQALHLLHQLAIPYDYVVSLSGSTYPIKSNEHIKQVLSRNAHTLFMDVWTKPFRPPAHLWHHYVECDSSLHRIARLSLPRGMHMYQGSQWFGLPRDAAAWLMASQLTSEFVQYAQHIVVPDEIFFSTLILNSPYCTRPFQKSLTFLLFDQWEIEKVKGDMRKCVGWANQQCGRSPLTLLYAKHKHLVQSSWALFARKFDPSLEDSVRLVDYIDQRRNQIDAGDRALWDSNRSHAHDQQAVSITIIENTQCLQFEKATSLLSIQVCSNRLSQQFATRGCLLMGDDRSIVCMIEAVGSGSKCITVSVKDSRLIVPGKEVRVDSCSGSWNQLFHLPSPSSSGFILLQPWDEVVNSDRFYCLEYTPALQNTSSSTIVTMPCSHFAVRQFFSLKDIRGVPHHV